jgi:hypothetical protein
MSTTEDKRDAEGGDGLRDLGIPPRGDGLRDLGTPEQFARLKPVKGRHYAYVRETGKAIKRNSTRRTPRRIED